MKRQEESNSELQFPAGMRVLVVDDDNTCLKLMDNLLGRCKYHVTTTNRAKEALRILKDSRGRFDIVISDVEMPDMDGIQLLQLVGLEMNIPVIMLSAFSDTKLVMQGIRNGACDYLVKPVRIQELQNIWQHVVRRNKSIMLRKPPPSAAVEQRAPAENDIKGKSIEDNSSGGDDDDSGRENEESTHQKKPRLFWSVELHQKFVDAVDSLGIDKAFPKKILDLMDVPGLTREKVASHLQKYRLYLKKVNNGSNEEGSKMSGYEDGPIGPLGGGYGVFRSLAGGTPRFPGFSPSLSNNQPLYGRLNTSAGLSIRGLATSPMLQNSSTSFTPLANSNAAMLQQRRAAFIYPPTNSAASNQNMTAFGNQSSFAASSSKLDGIGGSGCSNLQDSNRCPPSSNWGNSLHSSLHQQAFQNNMFTSNLSAPPMAGTQNVQNDPRDYLGGFDSLKGNLQTQNCQNDNGDSSFSYLGQSQIWQGHRADYLPDSCNTQGTSTSLIPPVAPGGQNNSNISVSPFTQLEGANQHQPNAERDRNIKLDEFLLDDPKLTGGSTNGSSDCLEDIVGKYLKQDNGETTQTGDGFDLDSFNI